MENVEDFILEYVEERMDSGESLEEALRSLYNETQREDLFEVSPVYKAYRMLRKNNPLTAKYDNPNDQEMQKYAAKAVDTAKRIGKGIWNVATKTPSFRTADDFIAHWKGKIGGMRQAQKDRVQGEYQKRKADAVKVQKRTEANQKLRFQKRKNLGLTPEQINKQNKKLKSAFKKKKSPPKAGATKSSTPKEKAPTKTSLGLTQKQIAKSNKGFDTIKQGMTKQKLMDKIKPKDKPVDPKNPMPKKPKQTSIKFPKKKSSTPKKPKQMRLPGF